jgi:DNA-binding PadR family transcriptional regulator
VRHVVQRSNRVSSSGADRIKPLGEPVLWILLSLAEEPRHGYGLMKNVETLSDGRVRLSTGTMYGALRRLLEDGWIDHAKTPDASRDKQLYRLTPAGLAALRREVDHLSLWTRVAAARVKARAV